jgi:sigma-B regulation protein RsbU (phosphoserine phosphatase)
MYRLHITPAQGEPFDHLFEGESLIVGRSATSGLTLADPFLSRQHSRFFRRGEGLFVEDLGSRNGTLLNGQSLSAPAEVKPGDVIEISGSVLSVHGIEEPPTSPGAPVAARQAGLDPSTTYFRSAAELLDSGSGDPLSTGGGEDLRRYAARLKTLNEVHQALGRSLTLEGLLELILDHAFKHLRPEQGVIFLKRPDGELARVASRSAAHHRGDLVDSRRLAHEVVAKGLAALVLDARTDERFSSSESIMLSGVRSLVAAPLLDREVALGMIVLDSKLAVRQFSEEDMELLVCLASVAALYIRNLELAGEAAERRRLEEELALARRIQLALLPDRLPDLPGYQLYGGNIPSRGVSGDYFSVVERQGGRECVLMVADVSGKGMAASLLTASLEAFSAGPIEDGLPPDEIFSRLSRLLYRRTPPEKYATAFLAVLAPESGVLRYANAGHNPPLLVRAAGAVEELGATGTPLALLPSSDYRTAETSIGPGDTLVLYTDGIVEATDPAGEEYGLDRFAEVCLAQRAGDCSALAAALHGDLDAWSRGTPFADDRTLVILRRLG